MGDPSTFYHSPHNTAKRMNGHAHNTAKRMNGHAAETSANASYIGSMGLRDLGSKSFGSFGRNRNREGDLFRNKSFNSSVWRANGHGFSTRNDACDIYDEVFAPNNCSGSSIPALGDVWPRPSVTPYPKKVEVSERPVYEYDDELFSKPPSSSDIDYDAIFKDDPFISIKNGEDRAVLELQRRTNPQTDAAVAQNGHASPDQMRKAKDSSSSNGKSSSANGSLQKTRSSGDVSEVACQKLETVESSNGTYFPCIQSVASPSHIRAKKHEDRSEYHAQNGGLISFQIKEDYTIEPSEEPEFNTKCSPAISENGLNHVASTLDNVAAGVKTGNKVQNHSGALHEKSPLLNISDRIRSLEYETNLMELLKASSKVFPDADFQKGNILANGFIRNGMSERNLIDKLNSMKKKCVGKEIIPSVGSPNGHLENKHIRKMQTDDIDVSNDIIFQFEIPGQNDVNADMSLGSKEGTGRKPLKTQELSRASCGKEAKQLDEEANKEPCIEAKTEEVRAQDGSLKPEGLDRSSSGKQTKQIHLELNKENPNKDIKQDIKQEGKAQTDWITVDKIKLLTRPSQVRPPSRPPPKPDTQVTGRQAIAKSVIGHTALLPLRPPPPLKVEMHAPGAQATPRSVLEHSVLLSADEHVADDGHDISSNGKPLEARDNQNTELGASLKDGNDDMNFAGTGDNAVTRAKMVEREELISIQVSCDAISEGNVVAKDNAFINTVGSKHTDMAHGTRAIKRDEPQQKEEHKLDGGIPPMEKVEYEFSISTMHEKTECSALHTDKVSVPLRDDAQAKVEVCSSAQYQEHAIPVDQDECCISTQSHTTEERTVPRSALHTDKVSVPLRDDAEAKVEVCPSAQYQEHNIPVDQDECCISTQSHTTEERIVRGTETEANAARDDRILKNPEKANMPATTEAEDILTGLRSASDQRQHSVEEGNFAEEANGAETKVASDGSNVEEGRKVEEQNLSPNMEGRVDKENLAVEQENMASTIRETNDKVEGQEHAPEIERRVEKENLAPEEKEEKLISTMKETTKKVEQSSSKLEVNEETATKLESCSMEKQIEPETNRIQEKAFEKQTANEQKLAEKVDECQRNKTLTEKTPQLRAKAAAEARERLAAEARKRAERAAVERVTSEVRERAAAEARAKAQKAAAEKMMVQKDRISVQASEAYRKDKGEREVRLDELEERQRKERQEKEAREEREIEREKDRAQEKAAMEAREKAEREREARLRAERAAVERATAEARARLERAAKERAAAEVRERAQRTASEKQQQNSRASSTPKQRVQTQEANAVANGQRGFGSEQTGSIRRVASSVNLPNTAANGTQVYDFWEAEGENPERQKARLERHQRTAERVAKALAEKNQRDLELQREQAEKQRLAERLDADIKRWSAGKEGKLRALISTLQYVLWQGSGWKSIPLNDLVNPMAVKKAYRKATLCLHPDKVQQKGASIQQKYVAEKVFDLLKDAWNRFSAEEQL